MIPYHPMLLDKTPVDYIVDKVRLEPFMYIDLFDQEMADLRPIFSTKDLENYANYTQSITNIRRSLRRACIGYFA